MTATDRHANQRIVTALSLAMLAVLVAASWVTPDPNVPPATVAARAIAAECTSNASREPCYARALAALAGHTNLEQAFATLTALQAIDDRARVCHFVAHAIGQAEVEKDPRQWQELINRCPDACAWGCMHGVFEAYRNTLPNGLAPEMVRTACANARGDCTHILGHLLLVDAGGDIPKALRLCELLPQENRQRYPCVTGVFMEAHTAQSLAPHGFVNPEALERPERLRELEALCRSYGGELGVACWQEIVWAAVPKLADDPGAVFDFCRRHPDAEAQKRCTQQGIIVLTGSPTFANDPEKSNRICGALPPDAPVDRTLCLVTVVGTITLAVPDDAEHLAAYCAGVEVPFQRPCFRALWGMLSRLNRFSPERAQAVCAPIGLDVRGACLSGPNPDLKREWENSITGASRPP